MPTLQETINYVIEFLRFRMSSQQPIGISTGYPQLDDMFGGGLVRQQLSYLVGDSGVGKSWLASSFIIRGAKWLSEGNKVLSGYVNSGEGKASVANKENKPPLIVFWSLEMAESPVVVRMLSQVITRLSSQEVNSDRILRGTITEQEAELLNEAYTWLFALGEYVYVEFGAKSVADMEEVLECLSQTYDVVLLVVDYFRLIDEVATDGSMASLQAERSSKLRSLAKLYDCHVMSLFDINREGQKTQNRPSLANMRGGVAAQYDADLILVLRPHESMTEEKGGFQKESRLVLEVQKGRFVGKGSIDLYARLGNGRIEMWEGVEDAENGTDGEPFWGQAESRGESSGASEQFTDDHDHQRTEEALGSPWVCDPDIRVRVRGRCGGERDDSALFVDTVGD